MWQHSSYNHYTKSLPSHSTELRRDSTAAITTIPNHHPLTSPSSGVIESSYNHCTKSLPSHITELRRDSTAITNIPNHYPLTSPSSGVTAQLLPLCQITTLSHHRAPAWQHSYNHYTKSLPSHITELRRDSTAITTIPNHYPLTSPSSGVIASSYNHYAKSLPSQIT